MGWFVNSVIGVWVAFVLMFVSFCVAIANVDIFDAKYLLHFYCCLKRLCLSITNTLLGLNYTFQVNRFDAKVIQIVFWVIFECAVALSC